MPAKKKTVKRGGAAGKTGAGQKNSRGTRGGGLGPDRRGIAGLVLLGVGVLAFLCLLVPSRGGILQAMNLFFKGVGGRLCLLLPILLSLSGILLVLGSERIPVSRGRAIGAVLLFLFVETMLQLRDVSGVLGVLTSEGTASNWPRFFAASFARSSLNLSGGGALGAILAWPLYKWFDVWGGMFVMSLALIVTLMVMTGVSLGPLGARASEVADDLRVRLGEWRENRALLKEERAAERLEEKLARRREEEESEEKEEELRRQEAESRESSVILRHEDKAKPRQKAEPEAVYPPAEPASEPVRAEGVPAAKEKVLPFNFGGQADGTAEGRVSPFAAEPGAQGAEAGSTEAASLPQEGEDGNPYLSRLKPENYRVTPLYLHTDDEFEASGLSRNDPDFEEKAVAAFTGRPYTRLEPENGYSEGTEAEGEYPPESTEEGEDGYALAVSGSADLYGEAEAGEIPAEAESVYTPAQPGGADLYGEAEAGEIPAEPEAGGAYVKPEPQESPAEPETPAESFSLAEGPSATPAEPVVPRRRRPRRPPTPEPETAATRPVQAASQAASPAARTGFAPAPAAREEAVPGRRLDDTPLIVPKKEEHAAPEAPKFVYVKPPIDLLTEGSRSHDPQRDAKDKAAGEKLISTLQSFNVSADLKTYTHGPAITRYEIQPAPGVKVSRITSLADDIALNLASDGVRIEAPVPGKPVVGIEVPNEKIEMVRLREVLGSESMRREKSPTAVALGKSISGAPVIADMAKMPHVLIAGATGSGKSVCINTIIQSILFRATPQEVRLILIDPKVVELSVYNGIPHLLIPVVTDPKKASAALSWAVREMEVRYKQFESLGVRDIRGYNERIRANGEPEERILPKIILIIDELADLMMVAPGEVEDSICRLAQLARAAGIHLVIATQRPSVNVITGVIKANIPSRIAFAVSSQIDSRTILDTGGAEKLLGKGDMLYAPQGMSKPTRVQGCFVQDEEVQHVVDFIKANHDEVTYNEEFIEALNSAGEEEKGAEDNPPPAEHKIDEVFEQAVQRALEDGQTSISMLQRRLRIGYARAGRLIDQMTDMGIIGEAEAPSKPRKTLITRDEWERMKENLA